MFLDIFPFLTDIIIKYFQVRNKFDNTNAYIKLWLYLQKLGWKNKLTDPGGGIACGPLLLIADVVKRLMAFTPFLAMIDILKFLIEML